MSLKNHLKNQISKILTASDTTGSNLYNNSSGTASQNGPYVNTGCYTTLGSTTTVPNNSYYAVKEFWNKKEKETLAKVGLEYDPKTKEWRMRLSIDIKIPYEEVIGMFMNQKTETPTDQLIAKLKRARKLLIEKLTAKIILAELIKPREIKK